ncbi:MAG: GNAT family N-acetyltransferase [Cyanobacteria bacterium P01_D01_bin.156]
MEQIIIKRASLEDAVALAHLAERTFRDTFTEDDNTTDMELHCAKSFGAEIQQQEIQHPNYVTFLATIANQLVAFAQVRLHSPKECVVANHPTELYRFYVSQEWHGRGVAQQMMDQVFSTAAHTGADYIWLGVWEQNPRAIAFYRKYGFDVVGEHVFQFGNDPQRDLIMVTQVKQSRVD